MHVIGAGKFEGDGVSLQLENTSSGARDWRVNFYYDGTTSSKLMTLTEAGNLGIGTGAPGQKLDIAGGNGRVATSYAWLTNSDRRYKKNITKLQGALEKLEKISGVRFDLKEDTQSKAGKGKHIGVIAQEVEAVAPEMVVTDKATGYKAVAYDQLNALTIEAIKELKAENDQLKADHNKELQQLRADLEELKKKLQ